MICTNCYEADTVTTPITLLGFEVEGEKCPKCGDVVFTHAQSMEIDDLRREQERRLDEDH